MESRAVLQNLKPYPEYKDSGVPWIGKVPKHWQVLPHRAIFEEVKERNHPDEEMLSVTINNGVIKQQKLLDATSKKDNSNLDKSKYNLVCPNDIAYNKMRAWQGAIGVSEHRGIISPAYIVMRLRDKKCLPKYYHYLLRTPAFAKEAERWSYGITSDMWSLRPEHFKLIYSIIPPYDEQEKIVKYLDYATAKIDQTIAAKKKLIDLLNEQKQAIIHRAVTRGLDPNVKLKDSGIPWIGKVPEHWEKVRIKNIVKIYGRIGFRGYKQSDLVGENMGAISLSPSNIKMGELNATKLTYISWEKYHESPEIQVEKDDIVLVKTGSSFGKSAVVKSISHPMTINPQLVLLKKCIANNLYLQYLLETPVFKEQISRKIIGGATPTIGQLELGDICFYIPKVKEQEKVVLYINKSIDGILNEIKTTEKETMYLNELKIKIISDAVTGKIDTRYCKIDARYNDIEPIHQIDEKEQEESGGGI